MPCIHSLHGLPFGGEPETDRMKLYFHCIQVQTHFAWSSHICAADVHHFQAHLFRQELSVTFYQFEACPKMAQICKEW